jgi:hypothetical protein
VRRSYDAESAFDLGSGREWVRIDFGNAHVSGM